KRNFSWAAAGESADMQIAVRAVARAARRSSFRRIGWDSIGWRQIGPRLSEAGVIERKNSLIGHTMVRPRGGQGAGNDNFGSGASNWDRLQHFRLTPANRLGADIPKRRPVPFPDSCTATETHALSGPCGKFHAGVIFVFAS